MKIFTAKWLKLNYNIDEIYAKTFGKVLKEAKMILNNEFLKIHSGPTLHEHTLDIKKGLKHSNK